MERALAAARLRWSLSDLHVRADWLNRQRLSTRKNPMNLRSTSILIAIAFINCAQHQVNAGIITLADFSGTESIVDFGNPASSSVHNSPYTIGSVTFTTNTTNQFFVQEPSGSFSNNFLNVPGASLQGSLRDAAGIANFEISFANPVNRAGFVISGNNDIATFDVTAFNGTNVLQTGVTGVPRVTASSAST